MRLLFAVFFLLLSGFDLDRSNADESSRQTSSELVSHTESSDSGNSQEEVQKRKLEIGMILVAGILMLGLFLVAVILVYGRRTRRRLALGRGESSPRDDLWYLKHAEADSETPDSSLEDTQ